MNKSSLTYNYVFSDDAVKTFELLSNTVSACDLKNEKEMNKSISSHTKFVDSAIALDAPFC